MTDRSPGLGAYAWGSATMEEVHSWRKLPTTSGSSPEGPRAFHDRARSLLASGGYFVEEEGPQPAGNPHKGAPPEADLDGAVQGERELVADPAGARGFRIAVYAMLALVIVCFAGFFATVAFRYAPTAPLLIPGIILLLLAVAFYPNTRAFRSSMVWVSYRGPVGGPTTFELRAATVRSGNERSRHFRGRTLRGFDPDVATDSVRATFREALAAAPLA